MSRKYYPKPALPKFREKLNNTELYCVHSLFFRAHGMLTSIGFRVENRKFGYIVDLEPIQRSRKNATEYLVQFYGKERNSFFYAHINEFGGQPPLTRNYSRMKPEILHFLETGEIK